MQRNLKARLKRLEQKAGIAPTREKLVIVSTYNREAEGIDIDKGICIATSRKGQEKEYTELYRAAESGKPFIKSISTGEVIEHQYIKMVTPAEAREYMQAWNIPEVDIIAEWG